ncbi:MAG: hypothetical protein CMI01_13955 [Oceanospirillaceae bacterium]|jgi:hypothetical protein|nr:hypothetical protein [Oceanospirillaceae bacterium]
METSNHLLDELNRLLKAHTRYVEGMEFLRVDYVAGGYRHQTYYPGDEYRPDLELIFDEVAQQVYERQSTAH